MFHSLRLHLLVFSELDGEIVENLTEATAGRHLLALLVSIGFGPIVGGLYIPLPLQDNWFGGTLNLIDPMGGCVDEWKREGVQGQPDSRL